MSDPWEQDWSPASQTADSGMPWEKNWNAQPVEKTSTAADVAKGIAGNVAPNAAANFASSAVSAPATAASYVGQLGTKAGELVTQEGINAARWAQGLPSISDEEFQQQQKDLKNHIRGMFGMKPTEGSGDLASYVPTPSNLLSMGADAVGVPLYQPKTETGKFVTNAGNIVAGAKAAGMTAPEAIYSGIGGAGGSELAKQAGGNEATQFLAGLAGGVGGQKMGQNWKTPVSSPSSTLEENATNSIFDKSESYNPMDAHKAIGDQFKTALDKADTYYSLPQQIAGDAVVKAPQVKSYLSDVADDIESDPFHEARPMIKKLRDTAAALPDDGSVPVSTLMDLRKLSNKNFKPGRTSDKDSVYSGLNKAVNQGLGVAKEQIPDFSDALDIADNFWVNSVKRPFLDNSVLQKMWKPEDYYNHRDFQSGKLNDLPDETAQRANNLATKIKDVDSYNAVRRTLPDDIGQALDREVLNNVTPTRLDAAVKLLKNNIVHPVESIRNMADLIWPEATPAQKALIQAVKKQNSYSPLSERNAESESTFQNLKNSREQNISGLLESPSIKVPPEDPKQQLLLGGGGYDPFSPENIGKIEYSSKGPKLNEPVTRPAERTAADLNDELAAGPKMLSPPSAMKVPPGGFKRSYNPMDLNTGDEPAFKSLEDIAEGRKHGGTIPSATEWALMLNKARKKGYNLKPKDRLNEEKVSFLRKIIL